MKTKLKTGTLIVILSFFAINIFAQEAKLSKKEKLEIKKTESNNKFVEIINNETFRFTVFSIDANFAPTLSYLELKGGYMLYIKNKELTVLLPIGGPNMFRGNAPTSREALRFTTKNYNIILSTTIDNNIVATIRTKDVHSNNEFMFTLTNDSGVVYLTSYITGIDKVRYTGRLSNLK